MFSVLGPLSESLNPSRFPNHDGGFSTSTSGVWRPLKVSLIASNKHNMRVNSGDGNGLFVGGPYDYPS